MGFDLLRADDAVFSFVNQSRPLVQATATIANPYTPFGIIGVMDILIKRWKRPSWEIISLGCGLFPLLSSLYFHTGVAVREREGAKKPAWGFARDALIVGASHFAGWAAALAAGRGWMKFTLVGAAFRTAATFGASYLLTPPIPPLSIKGEV